MLLRCITGLTLLALVACRRAPPPAEAAQPAAAAAATVAAPPPDPALEPLTWTSYAQDGATLVSLTQTATAATRCTLVAKRGGDPAWTAQACIAMRGNLRYLSPNGDSLLVLEAEPEVEGPHFDVKLGALYRRGELTRRYIAGEVLGSSTGFPVEAGKLHWLADAEAKVDAWGVRIRLIDGRGEYFGWDGTGIARLAASPTRAPAQAQAVPRQLSCSGGCSYVDARGDVHFVDSADDIPERFRDRTRALHGANVNVVSGPAHPTAPSPVQDAEAGRAATPGTIAGQMPASEARGN